MYKLYSCPQTGSLTPHAILAAAAADYEVVNLDFEAGEQRSAEFLAINPLGQVPVLVLPDGSVITESAAIILHLVDTFPECGLAPAPASSERARFYYWLLFMATNVYTGSLRQYYSDRYTTDPAGATAIHAAAVRDLKQYFAILDRQLQQGPWLLGERFSAVDIYLWMLCTWVEGDELDGCDSLVHMVKNTWEHPCIKAIKTEHFPDK